MKDLLLNHNLIQNVSIQHNTNCFLCCLFLHKVVQDVTPPVYASCPNNIELLLPPGGSGSTVDWTEPTVTDNSGGPVTTDRSHLSNQFAMGQGQQTGFFFMFGVTQVVYTFTDPSNNVAICSFNVTIGCKYSTIGLLYM